MAHARGFTLLESIVALTILSFGLMAAFSWFERDVDALQRTDRLALEAVAIDHAIEFLRGADAPAGQGELVWDDFVVRWETTPVEERMGRTAVGLLGYHDVYLLEAQLRIYRDARLVGRYETFVTKSALMRPPPEDETF